MATTRIGIPLPAQVNTRPNGRYKVQAPDAPVGRILRVTTREGSTRFVEVVCPSPNGRRLFVDLDSEPVEFCDWAYATRAEAETFQHERRIARLADEAELRGAPALVAAMREVGQERDMLLRAVVDELRVRGKSGKASQVLAFLEES
jgi:hypothetical protein